MKFVKFTAVALFVALATTSCLEEKISFNGDDNNTITNTGLLSISNLEVDCRIVESTPDGGIDPKATTASTLSTRTAVDTDIFNFDCSIINEENEVVMAFKYAERPTEAIELETGQYIFKIQSGEIPGAAWEHPVYGTTKAFKIVRNETTTLSEIVCNLLQIQVSISFSEDLLERLGAKTLAIVTVGDNSLEYSLSETRSGFFFAPQSSNTIKITINGTYAADLVNEKPMNMTKEIRNVTAGQYSKIHFYIEHAAEGNINADATIRDWVVDEIIPCNVADLVKEEEWKEPGSGNEGSDVEKEPITVVWDGYDMSQRVTIDSTTTGEITIYAINGIKELIVHIDSQSLAAILPTVGLVDVINLSYPEKSYDYANPQQLTDAQVEQLKTMLKPVSNGGLLGFPYGDDIINKTEVLFSITSFMGALAAFPGNHDFHFTIIDNEGNTINLSLMLKSN